jgi:hypothetical protein
MGMYVNIFYIYYIRYVCNICLHSYTGSKRLRRGFNSIRSDHLKRSQQYTLSPKSRLLLEAKGVRVRDLIFMCVCEREKETGLGLGGRLML